MNRLQQTALLILSMIVLSASLSCVNILRTDQPDTDAFHRKHLTTHAVKMSTDIILLNVNGEFKDVEGAYVGSGVIVGHVNDKTIIVTANHVCKEKSGKKIEGYGLIMASDLNVITLDEKKHEATILLTDTSNDVCTVIVDGYVGQPAEVSKENPPIGAEVYTVGAPSGVWGKDLANITSGYYSGIRTKPLGEDEKNFNQYSIPVVGGQSGSGIFYRGKLIGIITHVLKKYPHVSWGPQAKHVEALVNKSVRLTKALSHSRASGSLTERFNASRPMIYHPEAFFPQNAL